MKTKFMKNLMFFAVALLIVFPMFAFALTSDQAWGGKEAEIKTQLGLGDKDPREMAASILNITMGFLGIVAVVIILIGGFKWMVAGGDEAKVEESVGLIKAGVIGLIIILASFAIAKFVIDKLVTATA